MSSNAPQKYGQSPGPVEQHPTDRRGRRRSMRRTAAELRLDDRYRERFAHLVANSPEGRSPSRAISDIVDGQQAPWRPTARRVRELLDAGYDTGEIKAAVWSEMDRWIDEEAARRHLPPAA